MVDKMVGWHHQLGGHEFELTPGVGDGQGGLACCSSWGPKELDTTERLKWNELNSVVRKIYVLKVIMKTTEILETFVFT